MKSNYFIPQDESGKLTLLDNFSSKLPTYNVKYGITAAEVTDMRDSNAYYRYWTFYKSQYEEYVKKLTAFKNELRNAPLGSAVASPPVPPTVGVAPAAVSPGIFKRLQSLAARIKNHTAYTDSDGKDLGIVGIATIVDIEAMKPTIAIRLINGGHPELQWLKMGMDGIDIYKDSGDGNFVFVERDLYPNYTDKSPLPAAGSSAIWRYKVIYHHHDAQVGLWSDIGSVTVSGF
ncbi:MAG: hypothetical protein ORN55_01705 [Chitinophagaceae bacterium]|nr:hypothetical protein [Chitinophagaceae bacterium]